MDETSLTIVLADLAGAAGTPVTTISVDRAITDGRRRIRNRRMAAATAGAVALITLAAAAIGVHSGPRPNVAGSSAVLVYEGSTVRRVDGTLVARLDVPANATVRGVVRVPTGWLVLATPVGRTGTNLRFQPDGGTARPLVAGEPSARAEAEGVSFTVTRDGSTVIVAGLGGTVAYDLPSLSVRRTLTRPGEFVYILSQRGDQVVLGSVTQREDRPSTFVWDLRSGVVTPIIDAWGLLLAEGPTGPTLLTDLACAAVSSTRGRSCWYGSDVPTALDGWRTPVGETVVLGGDGLVAVEVLGAPDGRVDTAEVMPFHGGATRLDYWLDDTRFVADDPLANTAFVCEVKALDCEEIALRTHVPGSGVVIVVGGG